MRLTPILFLPAVCLAVAACSGRPADSLTHGGAFLSPTGPTMVDVDGGPSPADVCPPPPEPPPDGCTPASPNPSPSPGEPSIPVSPYTWMPEGPRLDNAAAGFGGVIADTTNIQLGDGRWRMYVYTGGQYRSAISSDGLTFTMESGTRLPQGMGHTRVIRLPDGRIRAYSQVGDGIVSSISSDEGVTFTRESGHRLTATQIGFTPSGPSNLVRMPDGQYRMYFSDLPRPGEGVLPHRVLSASSVDLLTWTLDAGVRLGEGSALTGNAEHPGAIVNPDGSVSLFYFRNTNFKMLMATAADGLTFTSEFDSGISNANDPDLVRAPDGTVRMYYNWGDEAGGAIYSAQYSGAPFAPSARVFGVLHH